MEIKNNLCIGYKYCSRQNKLNIYFSSEGEMNNEKYYIEYYISTVNSDFYTITTKSDIILNIIPDVKIVVIEKIKGNKILERFHNDIKLKNQLKPIIKEKLLNKRVEINFAIDENSYKILFKNRP